MQQTQTEQSNVEYAKFPKDIYKSKIQKISLFLKTALTKIFLFLFYTKNFPI